MGVSRRISSVRRSSVVLAAAAALVVGPLAVAAPAEPLDVVVDGVVTGSDGKPVEDAEIAVWVKDVDEGAFVPDDSGTYTDSKGRYALFLEPGTYRLGIFPDDAYKAEYYNDATRLRNATSIVVESSPQTLAPVELALRPLVTGTIAGESGAVDESMYVLAFESDGQGSWEPTAGAGVLPDGTYRMPLAEGTYRFGFFDDAENYRTEYWDDVASIGRAKDVVVGAAGVTGISARLTPFTQPVFGTVQNVQRPRAEGYAAVGEVLSSTDGLWSVPAPALTRQWLRNGVPIPGATDSRYQVTAADVGAALAVRVTASTLSMNPGSATSDAVGPARWHVRAVATVRPGRKKATVTVRLTSRGGPVPTGTVQIKDRRKVVKTVRVRHGRAVVTFKGLGRTKSRYQVYYQPDGPFFGARDSVTVKAKRAK